MNAALADRELETRPSLTATSVRAAAAGANTFKSRAAAAPTKAIGTPADFRKTDGAVRDNGEPGKLAPQIG